MPKKDNRVSAKLGRNAVVFFGHLSFIFSLYGEE